MSLAFLLLTSLFSVNYATDSVNLGTFNGTVFGPLFLPTDYSRNVVDVNWIINVPSGLNVYLQFITVEMVDGDFVSAYDGNTIESSALLKSSNSNTNCPFAVISSSTSVTVRYVGLQSRSKFYATYAVPVTSSTMLKSSSAWQDLSSPGYPGVYGSNLNIVWNIYAPIYYNIEIRWQTFSTELNNDLLTIYDGEDTFVQPFIEYSGNLTSGTLTWMFSSTSNYLTLRFTSNNNDAGDTGFLIHYINFPSGAGPTTAPPLLPTTIATTATPAGDICSNRGDYSCNCVQGYTGQNCENEIDFCDQLITGYTGAPVKTGQLCLHGQCVSSPTGASCNCNRGFSGQFCQDEVANQTVISTRCALYSTNTTKELNIPLGCPTHESCIPEDLKCAIYQACEEPIGWCIPSSKKSDYLNQIKMLLQKK